MKSRGIRILAAAALFVIAAWFAWVTFNKPARVRSEIVWVQTPPSPTPAPDGEVAPTPAPQVTPAASASANAQVLPQSPSYTPTPPVVSADAVSPDSTGNSNWRAEAMVELDKVHHMIGSYHTLFGQNPVGTNAEIMSALMGHNPRGAMLGPPPGQSLDSKGELLDPWGTPYFFHQLSGDDMQIISAGPDKIMGTADDLMIP